MITGGFGGGPQQLPHCAPMYASVLSLLLIGTPEAYTTIDRFEVNTLRERARLRGGGWVRKCTGSKRSTAVLRKYET